MKIRIPRHKSLSSLSPIRTRELIFSILTHAQCKIMRIRGGPTRTIIMEAERLLKKGRIHIKASCVEGNYVMDVHYDSEKHRKRPRGITRGHARYLGDCPEVRKFVNQLVLPAILAKRTHCHVKIHGKWLFTNTLLDEK